MTVHKAPSRARYEQANPTLTVRIPRAAYDRVMVLRDASGLSLAEWVKRWLDSTETNEEARAEGRSAGFAAGDTSPAFSGTRPAGAAGTKFDTEKPPLGLFSRYAMEETGRVLGYGLRKYSAHNWRKGLGHQSLINAALRHIYAWNEGEDNDQESGLSHLAHAMCMIMFALEEHELHPELDDRWKRPQRKDPA